MRKIFIYCTILLAGFVGEVSASPGVSLKGNGLSFGNVRSEGSIVDGLSLTLGSFSDSNRFDEINGISLSLIPASRQINGLSISPLFLGAKNKIKGIVLSPILMGLSDDITGIAIGGVVLTKANVTGIVVSGFSSISKVNGLAISLGALIGELNGVSISLCFCDPTGIGIGIRKVNGVQIGFINFAQELHGVQIGLINYAGNNPLLLRIVPGINIHF